METAAAHPKTKQRHSPFAVFIADDDEVFLYALSFRLKKNTGWRIHCFTSAEDCLARLHLQPDAIVMDYYFEPSLQNSTDGLQALKLIRRANPEVPVIMLSAQKDLAVSIGLIREGAYTYIVKDHAAPSAIEQSLQLIEAAVGEKK